MHQINNHCQFFFLTECFIASSLLSYYLSKEASEHIKPCESVFITSQCFAEFRLIKSLLILKAFSNNHKIDLAAINSNRKLSYQISTELVFIMR